MELLLCQKDAYVKALDADVVECKRAGDLYEVVLSSTPFYPGGGGQPADTGRIGGIHVISVSRRNDGKVVHILPAPISGHVNIEIDWQRRFDNMQQHTAQHMLTAIALATKGFCTLAFHLGPERCDIDLGVPEITEEDLDTLEEAVNSCIRAALPVRMHMVDRASLDRLKVRSRLLPKGFNGPFRLIEIEGVDLNTCGGLHVANTAEIQALKLIGTEKITRGTRLFFIAGGRVLSELSRSFERDRALTRLLTCGRDEHIDSIERLLVERRNLEHQLRALKTNTAASIGKELAFCAGPETLLIWHSDSQDMQVLCAMAFAAREVRPDILVLAMGGDGLLLFTGPEERISSLWSSVSSSLEVRGGGRDGIRQGKALRLDRLQELLERLRADMSLHIIEQTDHT